MPQFLCLMILLGIFASSLYTLGKRKGIEDNNKVMTKLFLFLIKHHLIQFTFPESDGTIHFCTSDEYKIWSNYAIRALKREVEKKNGK